MNRKKGFTFIELILAVTIFAIIAVSIYSVFRVGIQLWYRTSPLIQANQSVRLFFNTISLDLKNSIPYNKPGVSLKSTFGEEKKSVNFEGEKQKISFYALVEVAEPPAPPHTELARIIYSYDRNKKSVKRAVAAAKEGLSETEARFEDILENVDAKDFGFEYCYKLGSSKTEYDYEWKDEWEEEDRDGGKIPRGVKVKALDYSKTIFIPTGKLGGKDAS